MLGFISPQSIDPKHRATYSLCKTHDLVLNDSKKKLFYILKLFTYKVQILAFYLLLNCGTHGWFTVSWKIKYK